MKMALRKGALRLNLAASRHFYQLTSVGSVRTLSGNVSSKPKDASGPPEIVADHVLYTQEHFALKESLKKV